MIGATITCTGTPAALSSRTARRRLAAVLVRGSRSRRRSSSNVVMLNATDASRLDASSESRSMSRSTRAFLVIKRTGCPKARKTSSSLRVIRSFRSTGW